MTLWHKKGSVSATIYSKEFTLETYLFTITTDRKITASNKSFSVNMGMYYSVVLSLREI